MTSKEVNELLLKSIPEIKKSFEEETSWQDGIETGSIVVFEDVFFPYIMQIIDEKKKSKIDEIFSFIEESLKMKDDYLTMVIKVSVLENFASFNDPRDFEKFLQPITLKEYKSMWN